LVDQAAAPATAPPPAHKNVNALDFALLLPDVMIIADEVDAQLTQTVISFMKIADRTAVA
jgi:hypothetical protein